MKAMKAMKAMKIIRFQAENIKRLTAVEIEPNGSVIKISGKNGAGKTSILDSIWYAMAGSKNIPEKPIRDGELSARIKLDIGELIVERKFTNKGSTLRVTAADGTPITKPQNVLDELLGKLTFDPLKFSRMKSREQFDELMNVVDIDHEEIGRLDTDREKTFYLRAEISRTVKTLRTRIDAFVIPANAPTEEVDAVGLSGEIEKAGLVQQYNDLAELRIKELGDEIERNANKIDESHSLIDSYKDQINVLETSIRKADLLIESKKTDNKTLGDKIEKEEKFLSDNPVPEISEVRERLSTANQTNAIVIQIKEREQLRLDISEKEKSVSSFTDDIDKIDEEKRRLMTSAKFPVEGLSFKSGEVLYQNLPFDQASAAEQLRVSMAMAMAVNPGFKVIRITDGSLMDSESFKIIEEMANDKDFQVWVEVVDESGEVGVVVEDGHVAKVND